jgi:hypothetical protein
MSLVLNEVYGHAMLEQLNVFDLCMLYRVDIATRAFLNKYGILRLAVSRREKLLVCVELDLLDQFKCIVAGLGVEQICDEDDKEEAHKEIVEVCNAAIAKGKIEYLEATEYELYALYNWEDADHDDYSFDFMECAVKCNKPSVVRYLLERTDEEGEPHTDECTHAYLYRGLRAAVSRCNKDAAEFFLGHPGMRMYSKELNLLLQLNDNAIYDKYIDRGTLLYFWYDNWYSIKSSLNITLMNFNAYLYEKVRDLALSLTRDAAVREDILKYKY